MPQSCAYRLLHEGKPLPRWHPLVTGDPESTHKAGQSVLSKFFPKMILKKRIILNISGTGDNRTMADDKKYFRMGPWQWVLYALVAALICQHHQGQSGEVRSWEKCKDRCSPR